MHRCLTPVHANLYILICIDNDYNTQYILFKIRVKTKIFKIIYPNKKQNNQTKSNKPKQKLNLLKLAINPTANTSTGRSSAINDKDSYYCKYFQNSHRITHSLTHTFTPHTHTHIDRTPYTITFTHRPLYQEINKNKRNIRST